MLSDYRRYLLKIRNSLIRCGVGLEVIDTQDYEELFYLGEKLSDLLWFYSVLEISGSEDRLREFIFPLNSSYRGNLRDTYFEDYLVYRLDYMKISASDAITKSQLDSKEPEEAVVNNPISLFLQKLNSVEDTEEDEFLNEGTKDDKSLNEEPKEVVNNPLPLFLQKLNSVEDTEEDEFLNEEPEEDCFSNWLNAEDELEEEYEPEEEECHSNWCGAEDELEEEYELEEEECHSNWCNAEEGYGDTIDEDVDLEGDEFISHNSVDCEEEEDSPSSWRNIEELDEEPYEESTSNWGNFDDDEVAIKEDTSNTWGTYNEQEYDADTSYTESEEDSFSNWGGSDDELFSTEEDEEGEEDSFSNWGSSDEVEEDDSISEYIEEDSFSNWGSNEEMGNDYDDNEGNDFGSWGTSYETSSPPINNSDTVNSPVKKSKLDYEIESNEKTAEVIKKIASGILGGSSIFKYKLSEKLKNKGSIQD